MSGAAVVSGHTPDGRRITVCVPYIEVPGFTAAGDAAMELAHEQLDAKLADVESSERLTGRWACCGGRTDGDHASNCAAAHPDGTPR